VLVNQVVVQELEVAEPDEDVVEQEEEEEAVENVLAPPVDYVPTADLSTSSEESSTSTSAEEEQSMRFGEQLATHFLLDLLSQSIVDIDEQNAGVTSIEEWQNLLRDRILHYRNQGGVPYGQAE
jgi:hypothetical protein